MEEEIKVETQEPQDQPDEVQTDFEDALQKSDEENQKSEVESLQAEVESLKKQLEESSDRLLRLSADHQNFRRRVGKEKTELSDVVTQNLIKDLLPVIDGFSRAIEAESKDLDAFKKGVDMLAVQFGEILKKNGLETINAERGTEFNPEFHQAVQRVADEEIAEGHIAQELQRGFIVKGRVIRPSMVAVSGN